MTVEDIIAQIWGKSCPPLVVYCGSTSKCAQQFQRAQLYDTIRPDQPRMFLTIGCAHLCDDQLVAAGITIDKPALDLLHFWKIRHVAMSALRMGLIGEVCILDLNDNGEIRIGDSTQRELDYACLLIAEGFPLTIRLWSQEQEQVRAILRDLVIGEEEEGGQKERGGC